MTYSVRNIVAVRSLHNGGSPDNAMRKGFFGTKGYLLGDWGSVGNTVYTYVWGCHAGHLLELFVAILCYVLFYWDGHWLMEAQTWQVGWMAKIILFNLACEFAIVPFWHYNTYAREGASQALKPFKFNPVNQYEPQGGKVGFFSSSTGNLQREVVFTTLGWLQSALWQCLFTHLWATGYLQLPDLSVPSQLRLTCFLLFAVAYWREIHFYFAHRGLHPWFDRERGLLDGDIGAFLYRHVHSLHHKSYNPGPWSGLCMHPVEHFFYYSCATLPPLVLPCAVHPLVFLYCKFHADIAPIGGHDGHEDPMGNGDFHWLHHAKFECNYGVPFPINMDRIFGTWSEYKDYKETGRVTAGSAKANAQMAAAVKALGVSGNEVPLLNSGEDIEKREFTLSEVAPHATAGDCWVVLHGRVLDVTAFLAEHPGGEKVLLGKGGTDATKAFDLIHTNSGGIALVEQWPAVRQIGTVRE